MARELKTATSDYLVSSATPITAAPMTFSCWFRPDNVTADMTLVDIGLDNNVRFSLISAGQRTGDPIRAQVNDGAGVRQAASGGAPIVASVWQMGTAVFRSPTDRSAYLNGGGKGNNGQTATPVGVTSIKLGRSGTGLFPMNGQICQVTIWNVGLSDADIATLYNGGIALPPGTIRPEAIAAHYNLFESDGDVDSWGDGTYDLTAVGSPTYLEHVPIIQRPVPTWRVTAAATPGVTIPVTSGAVSVTGYGVTIPGPINTTAGQVSVTGFDATVLLGVPSILDDALFRLEDDISDGPNPWIANTNNPARYDESKAGPRAVLKVAYDDWRMWWECIEETGTNDATYTAYASSANGGVDWTKDDANNPVFTTTDVSPEFNECAPSGVVWDPVTGKLHLYYHGGNNAGTRRLYLATSTDGSVGKAWTRENSGNPIVALGTGGDPDVDWHADPKVMRLSASDWVMLYRGNTTSVNRICRATSTDGITWTRDTANSPVIDLGTGGQWDESQASACSEAFIDDSGRMHVWYVGESGAVTALGYAYSDDSGSTFTKGGNNPVLSANLEADSPDAGGASDTLGTIDDGDKVLVTYGGFESTNYTGPFGSPTRNICASWIANEKTAIPATPGRLFGGTTGQVQMASGLSLLDDTVFTIAARVKAYRDDSFREIYSQGDAFNQAVYFRFSNGGLLEGYLRTPALDSPILAATRLDDNDWHNVSYRRNSSGNFDLVADGAVVANQAGFDPGTAADTPNIAYGNWHTGTGNGNEPFLGTISRIAVWENDALTDAEIEAFLSAGTLPAAGAPTWWHDPGSTLTSTEPDLSGNGNTGTVTGLTTYVVDADPLAGLSDLSVSAVTIPVSVGAVEVAGLAAGVSAGTDVDVTLGAVEVSGLAVGVSAGTTVAATVGAVEVAGLNPQVSAGTTVAVGVGTVEVSGLAVDVSGELTVDVKAGLVEVAGRNATSSAQTIVPATVGAVEVTGFATTVIAATVLDVTAGSVEVSGLAVTLPGTVRIDVKTGLVEVVGHKATTSSTRTIDVTTGAVEVSGLPVFVDTEVALRLTAGAVEVTSYNPSVSSQTIVEVAAGSVEVAAVAATVINSTDVTVSLGRVEVNGYRVAVTETITATLGLVEVSGYLTTVRHAGSVTGHDLGPLHGYFKTSLHGKISTTLIGQIK